MQTLLAAAGETDLKAKLLRGATVGDKTFKVHLDGYDQRELLKATAPAARARSSSTGPTTAGWPACATTSGSSPSWSSAATASTSGRTRW